VRIRATRQVARREAGRQGRRTVWQRAWRAGAGGPGPETEATRTWGLWSLMMMRGIPELLNRLDNCGELAMTVEGILPWQFFRL
jgi:hypothetical protein